MSPESHHRIAFAGGRSGTAPATWGQRAIWDAVAALPAEDAARYTVRGAGPVSPGYSVATILEALGRLVTRHESLRTHLAPDADGLLTQHLAGAGEGLARVVRRAADDDPAEAAVALLDSIAAEPFDTANEWGLRAGIVESGGAAEHVVFAVAHTAVDGWGLRHMVLDLANLTVHGADAPDSERVQPLDEAAYQASARGRRQDAAARRHWCGKVERGPMQLLAPGQSRTASAGGTAVGTGVSPGHSDPAATTPDPDPDRLFPNALLRSPALARALPALATHLAVSPAAVLLAAAATMVGRIGGADEALFQVVVNNRFLPGMERAVSTLAQEGLFHLPALDAPFGDLVRTAFGASLATYRHAYYDKAALDRDLAGLRAAGTARGDLTCFVNDTRGLMPGLDDSEPADLASQSLDDLREHTVLQWPQDFPPRRDVSFALDAVDVPGSLGLTMTADPDRLPRPAMERLLSGIEELVVEEALRTGAA